MELLKTEIGLMKMVVIFLMAELFVLLCIPMVCMQIFDEFFDKFFDDFFDEFFDEFFGL